MSRKMALRKGRVSRGGFWYNMLVGMASTAEVGTVSYRTPRRKADGRNEDMRRYGGDMKHAMTAVRHEGRIRVPVNS